MVDITELNAGEKVRLIDFGSTEPSYRRKLLALGITCGVELSVIRVAPLGCPLQINVRGTSIVLRKKEASCLILERI